ncbi:four helix bundle protein [Chroogloeocystis siderophila]|jgi:four helix bundle protein|uniref:Four helix bundle protein n=1 Tax=Chroogloeocystis siderophila 5.2 s.c.1 TaxID=247279 RepID=A0A1U7HX79_9CHRO|nr:four helix bundle protein [Chroogloeocystis siderophila]OKH28151.1 four helix bundle protein [Chroogloeocystis siderophila 5.2 s.c.1]
MGSFSYKDLKVWQNSMEAEHVYLLTQSFPRQETYGLTNQLQKAAISIPSNIAEGHTRDSTKEFLHFLSIALGSLAELKTQLLLAQKFKYLSMDNSKLLLLKTEETARMLRGLQKTLKAKLNSP